MNPVIEVLRQAGVDLVALRAALDSLPTAAPAGWTPATADTWHRPHDDGGASYLLDGDGHRIEAHIDQGQATVHVYAGSPAATPQHPLDGYNWQSTVVVPALVDVDPTAVWAWLRRYAARLPAGIR
jgi:hypothetical protein